MNTAILSFILLIAIIVIAAKFNKNPGFLGVLFAFILGFFVMNEAGVPISSAAGGAADIIAGFPTNTVLQFATVGFLFAIASTNGTMEKLVYMLLKLVRGNLRLIPIVIFLINAVVGYFGGTSAFFVLVLVLPAICKATGVDYLTLALLHYPGNLLAQYSRFSPAGILTNGFAQEVGVELGMSLDLTAILWMTLSFILIYIIRGVWKWPKHAEITFKETEPMNKTNYITLIAMAAYVVLIFMGFNMIVVSISVSCVMMFITKVDVAETLKYVPWNTLFLIGGMGMFVACLKAAGGTELVSNLLTNVVTERNVAPAASAMAALLNMVSDGIGVVLPTMIPLVTSICVTAGINPVKAIIASSIGNTWASMCPLSTGGAYYLAYQHGYDSTKLFVKMTLWGIGMQVFLVVLCACNIFIIV